MASKDAKITVTTPASGTDGVLNSTPTDSTAVKRMPKWPSCWTAVHHQLVQLKRARPLQLHRRRPQRPAHDGALQHLGNPLWEKQVNAASSLTVRDDGTIIGTGSGGTGVLNLQGLALAFDSNQDGVFDAQVARFGKFNVWQYANQNGLIELGELSARLLAGIASINLVGDGVQRLANGQMIEHGHSQAQRVDGSLMHIADVTFTYQIDPAL